MTVMGTIHIPDDLHWRLKEQALRGKRKIQEHASIVVDLGLKEAERLRLKEAAKKARES